MNSVDISVAANKQPEINKNLDPIDLKGLDFSISGEYSGRLPRLPVFDRWVLNLEAKVAAEQISPSTAADYIAVIRRFTSVLEAECLISTVAYPITLVDLERRMLKNPGPAVELYLEGLLANDLKHSSIIRKYSTLKSFFEIGLQGPNPLNLPIDISSWLISREKLVDATSFGIEDIWLARLRKNASYKSELEGHLSLRIRRDFKRFASVVGERLLGLPEGSVDMVIERNSLLNSVSAIVEQKPLPKLGSSILTYILQRPEESMHCFLNSSQCEPSEKAYLTRILRNFFVWTKSSGLTEAGASARLIAKYTQHNYP